MNALKEARLAAGLKQHQLAKLAKTSQPQIRRLENGEREFTKEWAERLAPHVKRTPFELLFPDGTDEAAHVAHPSPEVQVIGEVAAGRYIQFSDETRLDFSPYPSDLPPFKGYPFNAQFDLKVSGNSINRFAADGDFLRCVSRDATIINNDDLVIFERVKDGGSLREVTVKRIRVRGNRTELAPYSTDPQWQDSVFLPYGEHEGEEGNIIGKVLFKYKPARGLP